MKNAVYILVVLLTAIPCRARTISVDDDGPADFNNIQAAIDDANNGDTVEVQPGTYTGPGNRDIDFLGKVITVRGTNPDEFDIVAATVLDCNGTEDELHRGFYFHSGEAASSVLEGVTITNGCAYDGGGIRCRYSSSPTIRNCIIRGNAAVRTPGPWVVATNGGAMYLSESSPIITNCYLLDNTAAGNGGAISSYAGTALVENCVITHNTAGGSGGAIACNKDNMSVLNCVIAGNNAAYVFYGGGGIYCNRSTSAIRNCTICGNSTTGYGGGIYLLTSDAAVVNSILWDNAASNGPEIALGYGGFGAASLVISYSAVRAGTAAMDIDPGCTLNWDGSNLDADPCFGDAGHWDPNGTPEDANDDFWVDGDYHLKSRAGRWDPNSRTWLIDDITSACIDAGNRMNPIGHEPFPNGGIINMGAYGSTGEASKSYFGHPPCETIVAGDINGDCKIDATDFAIMAAQWFVDIPQDRRAGQVILIRPTAP
ncbi:MAG: right-handed parallel beta-helix repeat-containing protein [Planctomycetes bacterium]|nr:right-handed parallel beta-helix repeat-containing protein [Planctomycetota bacterium]